jgi:hypothetical protein
MLWRTKLIPVKNGSSRIHSTKEKKAKDSEDEEKESHCFSFVFVFYSLLLAEFQRK